METNTARSKNYLLMTLPCAQCKTPVSRTPWMMRRRGRANVFCSQLCAKSHLRDNGTLAKENHPNWTGGPKGYRCILCREKFMARLRNGGNYPKFCSTTCAGEYKAVPTFRKCAGCRKNFRLRWPSDHKKYCKEQCRLAAPQPDRYGMGLRAELECMAYLQRLHYCVWKTENSRGPFDVMAFKPGVDLLFIQVKFTTGGKYCRRPIKHLRDLANAELPTGGMNIPIRRQLWVKVDGEGWTRTNVVPHAA